MLQVVRVWVRSSGAGGTVWAVAFYIGQRLPYSQLHSYSHASADIDRVYSKVGHSTENLRRAKYRFVSYPARPPNRTVRSGGPQSELDRLLRRAYLDTYGTQ